MILCPCCNRPMEADKAPLESLTAAPLEGRMRQVVEALARSYPRTVAIGYLVDSIYGDEADGGPLQPERTIHVYISRLRRLLPAYGWTIPNNQKGFGSHSRYRLEPITMETR